MTQAEQINLINSLVIDNNVMAVTPAIMRQVLIEMVMSQTPSPIGSFTAESPLQYDAFFNKISLPPIRYQTRRVKAKFSEAPGVNAGDIVEGWSPDGKSWWDSAVYNGGDFNNVNSFTVIVGTQVLP